MFFNHFSIKLDAPTPWGLFFQDSATPQMEGLEELHNNIMFYLAIILFAVTWIMFTIIRNFVYYKSPISHKYMNHGKYVPIQKCSKLNNIIFNRKLYISLRSYTTLSNNYLENNNINHVKFYEDAYNMKKDIFKENKGKSGIYMLTNKLTNDIYIGQSIDISKRFRNYFNLSYINSKNSSFINKALIEYGYSNFSLTILEYSDKSDLIVREQYYFDKLNPQYNILKIAGSSLNFKHSEETKLKISRSLKNFYIKEKSTLISRVSKEDTKIFMNLKDNKSFVGKTQSKDTINIIRQLGKIQSKEIKLKISTVRGNPVNIYEKSSSEGFKLISSFVSARKAGKFLDISGSTVIKYMNSGEIFKERYKFTPK
jgi:group I intron endonuclease